MDKFSQFISANLCGTPHQREIGIRGLKLIVGGGEVQISEGFWQLEPEETNIKVTSWTNDLVPLAKRVAKFLESYQRYASQEAIFVTFNDGKRFESRIVYPGEWGELVDDIEGITELLEFFCSVEDGREDHIPPYN